MARTAVVAGTASAVSGRVQRRQAEKFADRDAQIVAKQQGAYRQQQQPDRPSKYQQSTPASQAPAGDVVQELKDLAELRDQGVLTDEEFAQQKARVLAG